MLFREDCYFVPRYTLSLCIATPWNPLPSGLIKSFIESKNDSLVRHKSMALTEDVMQTRLMSSSCPIVQKVCQSSFPSSPSVTHTTPGGATQTKAAYFTLSLFPFKIRLISFLSFCCRIGEARSAVCVGETSGHKNNKQRKANRICITKGKCLFLIRILKIAHFTCFRRILNTRSLSLISVAFPSSTEMSSNKRSAPDHFTYKQSLNLLCDLLALSSQQISLYGRNKIIKGNIWRYKTRHLMKGRKSVEAVVLE